MAEAARKMPEPGEVDSVKVPANLRPFVDVLGVEAAIGFFLEFGGAVLYLPDRPQERGRLIKAVGAEKAAALAQAFDQLPSRIPLAKRWIAAHWHFVEGLPKVEIARRLHVTDVTVRSWLKSPEEQRARLERRREQGSLF